MTTIEAGRDLPTDRSRDGAFLTKLLILGAGIEFVVVEILIAVIFWKHPKPSLGPLLNVYTACLVASIPAVAGIRGYFIVEKFLVSHDDSRLALRLSRLFLMGVIGAYTALVVIVEILS